jgi:hypothetical protein
VPGLADGVDAAVEAVPVLFTPPWWLHAPLPLWVVVVPSLQSTGAAVVAGSAALLASGKANTPAKRAP